MADGARTEREAAGETLRFGYLHAILIYLASRAVVCAALVFSKVYLTVSPDAWDSGPGWWRRLLRWDSEWYWLIATEGYSYNGNPNERQTVVFYPLYPLIARIVTYVTGLEAADTLLIVANLAALAAILLLFRIVRDEFGVQTALLTIALISFFPTSVLFSAGYTEPLALLLILLFFVALKDQRYALAALCAGLAIGTRSTGIVLLPVLLWEMWRNFIPREFWRMVLPYMLLATAGLWLQMIQLWFAFGAPLAISQAQAAFHEGTTLGPRLWNALTLEPFTRMNLTSIAPWALDGWFFLLFLALLIAGWFRLRFSLWLLAAGVLLLPYLTLSGGPANFISTARFNMVSFPLFIVLADVARRWRASVPLVAVFGALLFMYAALYTQWYWIG